MLKTNFETMQPALLGSLAQMMRSNGLAQGATGEPKAVNVPPLPAVPQSQGGANDGRPTVQNRDLEDATASVYVGGGLKVARTAASGSVGDGLVTTEAPPTFGGTMKLPRDEEGDLDMS